MNDFAIISYGVDPGLQYTGAAGVALTPAGECVSLGVDLIETESRRGLGIRGTDDTSRRMSEIATRLTTNINALRSAFGDVHCAGIEEYETYVPEGALALKNAAERLLQLGVPDSRERFIAQLHDDRRASIWVESIGAIGKSLSDAESWQGYGLGQAAKTIGVQWVAATVCMFLGVPFYINTAKQLKHTVSKNERVTKEQVGRLLESRIAGLEEHVASVRARTVREDPDSQAADNRASHVHDGAGHAYLAIHRRKQWMIENGLWSWR